MQRMIRHRRKTAQTDYKRRVALLKGGTKRLVVRRSNKAITMQIIEYGIEGDRVALSASSRELKALGWEPRCNIPTAYLTGMLLARKAKDIDCECVLDTGLYRPVKGSVIFAAARGFQDNGAKLRSGIEFDGARLSGSHIAQYAKGASGSDYTKRFSAYEKAGFDVKDIMQKFEAVKKEISNK
ncbi:MAG: 50S ribosomal protein L18 [Candidatus Micrarchaeaceae archaeon]